MSPRTLPRAQCCVRAYRLLLLLFVCFCFCFVCCPIVCADLRGTAPAPLVPASPPPATPKTHSASRPRPRGPQEETSDRWWAAIRRRHTALLRSHFGGVRSCLFCILGGGCHKYHFYRDKHVFVATRVCGDKSISYACRDINVCLSRQTRVFVATKKKKKKKKEEKKCLS